MHMNQSSINQYSNNHLQQNNNAKDARMVTVEQFSGPLPHPSILEKYEQVVQGSADRIIKKFEQQTDHRQKLEKAVIYSDMQRANLGLIFAFIIAMTTIIGGIYAALQGQQLFGGSLSFTGLALLVGAFLTDKYAQSKSKE